MNGHPEHARSEFSGASASRGICKVRRGWKPRPFKAFVSECAYAIHPYSGRLFAICEFLVLLLALAAAASIPLRAAATPGQQVQHRKPSTP